MVDVADKTEAQTPDAWLEQMAHSVKSGKISHQLITPGSTFEQALVKATIKNEQQLNGLVFWMAKLEQRGLGLDAEPPLDSVAVMIMRILIGSSSIGGKARFEAIESDAGIIDQMAHQTYITGKASAALLKLKKGFWRKEKDQRNVESEEVQ